MTQTAAAPRIDFRSYSQVKQLRTCGWQYKLQRIDRVPQRPSVPAVAGSAVHAGTEVIDQIIHANGAPTDDTFELALERALDDLDVETEAQREKGWEPETWKRYGRATAAKPHGEDLGWFREHGIPDSLNAYLDWRWHTHEDMHLAEVPGFGPAVEVPFNFYVGHQMIHGWIDRIFTSVEHGGYYPLDIKSGRKPETSEQLGLYSAALRRGLGWEINYGYYLYGLKTGEAKLTLPIDVTHWTDETIGSVYLPATQMIELGIYMPHPGEACFHCSVSDHCEFVRSLV